MPDTKTTGDERGKGTALYLRISTSDQTVANQERPLREWAARMGWPVLKVYRDVVSGAKASRPALNRLLTDAKHGKFRNVLVARLDRLGRSLTHLLWVVQELDRFGVALKDLNTGFDLATSTGRLTLGILGSIAQFERDLIIDRTRAGIARAKAEGKICSRPRKAIDGEVRRSAAEGKSVAAIARELKVSRQTVYNRLCVVKKASPQLPAPAHL